MNRYMAAAGAGANVASKAPAERGVAKAMDKVMQGEPRHALHPGSSAGLHAHSAAVIENADSGYRRWPRSAAYTPHLHIGLNRPGGGIHAGRVSDSRMPVHAPSHMDKQLAGLL